MGGRISFLPIQDGTGTPSPENVRPIRAPLYIDGIGEIYGGYVDIDAGTLTENMFLIHVNPSNTLVRNGAKDTPGYGYPYGRYMRTECRVNGQGGTPKIDPICNALPKAASTKAFQNGETSWFRPGNDTVYYWITPDCATEEGAENLLTADLEFVITKNNNPVVYPLTPAQLKSALDQLHYVPEPIIESRHRILMNTPHLVTPASSGLVTFNADMVAPLKECRVHFSPVQEGTGDPSPENVRPITGWIEAEVYRTGKNFINEAFLSDASNYVNQGAYGYWYTDYIQLVPSTKYRFVWFDFDDTQMRNCNLYVDGAAEYIISNGTHRQYSKGFTTSATGKIRFGLNRDSYSNIGEALVAAFQSGKLLLQIGTDDVSYEPYSGTTIPIDWSDSGTIYGGYVDLVKGEVVAEQKIIDLGSVNWTQRYAGGAYIPGLFYSGVISDKGAGGISLVCDRYPYQYNSKIDQTADKTINDSYQTRLKCVNIRDSDYNEYSAEEFRTAMSGVKCVYVLAEPICYPIDPITLKTLRGLNNVWSNANGDIDLSYFTHK